MHEELKRTLRHLAAQGERSRPIFFAGRATILDDLTFKIMAWEPDRTAGNTFLVSGAPGAGKTALGREAARILESRGGKALYCPDIPDDEEAQGIYKVILAALGGTPPHDLSVERTSVGADAKLLGTGLASETVKEQQTQGPHLTAARIAALLGPKAIAKAPPVGVFIDEAQNVEPNTQAARLLRDLHTQGGLPVTTVCIGLNDLSVKLANALVSPRMNASGKIVLGGYAPGEALDCASGSLEIVRGKGVAGTKAQAAQWSQALAAAADNWPRHLQCYLNATWEVLFRQPGRPTLANGLNQALRLGHEYRNAYYKERIELSKAPIALIGLLHDRLQASKPLYRENALDLIGEGIKQDLTPFQRRRVEEAHQNEEGLFNALLHVGLVSVDADQVCSSPIPSMSNHILETCKAQGFPINAGW